MASLFTHIEDATQFGSAAQFHTLVERLVRSP